MTEAKARGVRWLGRSAVAAGAILATTSHYGCGDSGNTTGTGTTTTGAGGTTSSNNATTTTSATMATVTATSSTGSMMCAGATFGGQLSPGANGGFKDPFDATPDANGTTVYFTAVDMNGNPGLFSQGVCPVGAVKQIALSASLEAPVGLALSTDDSTVYIADVSAEEDPTDPTGQKDRGVLFKATIAGGASTILVGSVTPRGVTVSNQNGADVVYFTGIDKGTGLPGVFSVPAAGGAVTVVAEGPPFSDPSGVAVASNGDVYVADTSGSGSSVGDVVLVHAGTATQFVTNLPTGYPAGIALLKGGTAALVSGIDPTANSDILVSIDLTSKAVTNNTAGIATFAEPAGLHRAANVDLFAWADSKATPMGMTGTGTVFVIK